MSPTPRHRVVVGGGGFAGLQAILKLSRFPTWLGWLLIRLWCLIGFQDRLLLTRWVFSFFTHGRGARLITNAE